MRFAAGPASAVRALGREGARHQTEDADRRAADHNAHDEFHAVGDVVHHQTCRIACLTDGNAQTDSPEEDADVVTLHQRLHGIVHHAIDQILKHFADASGGRHFLGVRNQVHRHRKQEEGDHGRGGSSEGTYKIEHQNRTHVCRRARLMVGNGSRNKNEDEHRGHGLQGRHKKAPQNAHGLSCARSNEGQKDAKHQSNHDLLNQTATQDQRHGSMHQTSRF